MDHLQMVVGEKNCLQRQTHFRICANYVLSFLTNDNNARIIDPSGFIVMIKQCIIWICIGNFNPSSTWKNVA